MKLHKIFLFGAVALATVFTSCSSKDDYTPGKQAGEYNVGFADESNMIVGLNDASFDVTLSRENTKGDLTVPVTVVKEDAEFTVPTSATFKDGESTTTISVGIPSTLDVAVAYEFTIRIPEEYTNPYKTDAYSPIFHVNITKEDYEQKYTGTMVDNFLYAGATAETWGVNVEYSASLDLYRVKDLFVDGYHFYFKWNTSTNVITATDSQGKTIKYFDTGYYYAYYGEDIVGLTNQATFYYDPATKTFHLPFYWYLISIEGGWGIYEDQIVLD